MEKIKTLVGLLLLLARSLKTLPLEDESSEKNENLDWEISEESYRLSGNAIPIHYDIKLIPYMEENNFTFDGETITRLNLKNMTRTLDFHSLELTFDETGVYLESEDGQKYDPIDFVYCNVTEIMTISFEKVIPAGIYNFYAKFTGIINDQLTGFYRSSYTNDYGEKVWLATTQFQATHARQAFPCWDEPSLKATFNVSIKHRTNYTALSNMPVHEISTIDESDDKMWTHFQRTPIMSTYTLAFVLSDFVNISNTDGTIRIWARSNILPLIIFGYKVALKASVLLEEYTNSSMLIPKMDHVVIPDYRHGAMENWGLITYDEKLFLNNPNTSSVHDTTMTAMIVVHELTHQWFGNVVSPIWWNHIWLNEGFASFFQYYITDKVFPSWGFMEMLPFHLQLIIHEYNNNSCEKPISYNVNSPKDIEDIFDVILYTKTQSLLNMLRHIVTDEVFHSSLINYLRKNQYSNALPDDLFHEIQIGVDNTPEISRGEFNVKEVMETWIYQGNYPLVTVKRNYVTGEATITQEIAKQCIDNNDTISIGKCDLNECNDKWWIPINYATETNTNFLSTLPVHWLSPKNDSIIINGIDSDDWIIINVQQTGHYQVNYDETNWIKLAKYLNSPNYEKIHVLNRAQIIQDSYSMMVTNRMNLTIFLDLFNYLSREIDYIVWRPILEIYQVNLHHLIETTEGSKLIKPYALNLMNNFIESVGFDFDHDDDYRTQLTKLLIRRLACSLGHLKCIMAANTQMIEFLEFSNKDQYPSDLKQWAYRYGINNLNESMWNKLWDIKSNNISEICSFLNCIEDETVIEKYLNMTIAENSPFTEDNCIEIYETLFYTRYETINLVTDFILRNWDGINSRNKLRLELSLFMIISATDKNKLQEIKLHLKDLNEDENIIKHVKKREKILTSYEQLFDTFKAWFKTKKLN
ncbi:thyrotropin-releasing hormone-degrading ectoenzyme-like [Polistes fuscatus]|uniref:thyrotropin-releasing hormone-degrading ectoenzyme-like n=1 Tax=Polistes fuscatus TaxID=30207 RepID=UPI001CA93574|nr:thyrotropin-releasing hormone-degrading ectoenzyme-like [Polistes fuscatus]